MTSSNYAVGTPGTPWGEAERDAWRLGLKRQRSHLHDVVAAVDRLRDSFDVVEYACITDRRLDGEEVPYALLALKSRPWNDALPVALVTGGVHGYETSGVHGALQFAQDHAASYAGRMNLIIVPCVSPWAYEHVQRWNAEAIDPNRSFGEGGSAAESLALKRWVDSLKLSFAVHIDLHETTDTDESEFRPALAARDGKPFAPGLIPDGFYVVGDTENPALEFQQAIIEAVAKVTHIAPADANGEIIESAVVAPGVILYGFKPLGLCAGLTDARFATTTEVYPDSPRATPEQCSAAQVAAVRAALDFALRQT